MYYPDLPCRTLPMGIVITRIKSLVGNITRGSRDSLLQFSPRHGSQDVSSGRKLHQGSGLLCASILSTSLRRIGSVSPTPSCGRRALRFCASTKPTSSTNGAPTSALRSTISACLCVPDLLILLAAGRKMVIYCETIELCWRVAIYLRSLLLPRVQKVTCMLDWA
ncbi:hypothetical protein Hypma_013312 [Hypsizygus marmoreus]|uniref:Uncharacterized protein n=1 Tax=Hypsizygus marmoreus TaxID=39966 RepID=A0A369JIY7_HYPMA|nr:hypothetical protein Hypma_013312 [Hypsizygus marmoreus]